MQLKNNYDDMIFNGDMGLLVTYGSSLEALKQNSHSPSLKFALLSCLRGLPEKKLEELDGTFHFAILFDGERWAFYSLEHLDQVRLGYACTVHKSQGSEYPAVVMPCLTQHYVMLYRNLFYTAVTRARKLCVVVGSKKAVMMAVTNNREEIRYSSLLDRLR